VKKFVSHFAAVVSFVDDTGVPIYLGTVA